MADQGSEHYQPWLRNRGGDTAHDAPPSAAGAPNISATTPAQPERAAEQPLGQSAERDARRLSVDDLLARPAPLPTLVERPSALSHIRSAWQRFADWTMMLGERLDAPARLERLRLGERAQAAVARGGAAAKTAGATVGDIAGRAADAAAPKLRAAADATRDTIAKGADTAREGLSHGAETLAQRASEARAVAQRAATTTQSRIAAAVHAPAAAGDTPESQLERLIERDGLSAGPAPLPDHARTDSGLPLFAASQPAGEPTGEPAGEPAGFMIASSAPPPASGAATPTAPAATASIAQPPLASATGSGGRGDNQSGGPSFGGGGATGGGAGHGWLQSPATWALGAVTLFLAGAVFGGWWSSGRVTPDAVRAALMAEPDMLPAAMTQLRTNSASTAIAQNRARIETPFSGAWMGNPQGDVTLTVFTDYACTFCRASEADIARLLREDRNLKVVFRELPILSPDSEAAARLALVAARAGRYQAMHSALFASGDLSQAARAAVATRVGVTGDAATMGNPAITREIESNVELARALGVDGTPAWVVGNRALSGAVGIDALRTAITEARAAQ